MCPEHHSMHPIYERSAYFSLGIEAVPHFVDLFHLVLLESLVAQTGIYLQTNAPECLVDKTGIVF